MSDFYALLQTASADVMATFKEDVLINGEAIEAIYRQTDYVDEELGPVTYTGITVPLSVAKLLNRGDTVQARDQTFKIKDIPRVQEPLIDIELRNA